MTMLCLGIVLVWTVPPPESPRDPHADEFAQAMQEILKTIQTNSITRPSPRRLVELGLRGLYKGQGEDLPDDLVKRLKNDHATDAELRTILYDGYHQLSERVELDVGLAVNEAISFTLDAIDPHARWRPTEPIVCWLGGWNGDLGVELRLDGKKGLPCVVTPIKDGPAYRAGLCAGDLITHVLRMPDETTPNNHRVPETEATAGRGLPAVEALLRGRAGSDVVLTVKREGVNKPLRLVATYGSAAPESVLGWRRKADDSWDFRLDKNKKIGYIRLKLFAEQTAKELEKALDELESQGVRGVVLDLRFCPGGLLTGSVKAAEQFLDKSALVTKVRSTEGQESEFACKDCKPRPRLKVVCLLNGDTSSAAEVFAAALQDHRRAVVVGERSPGKGSVQNTERFNDHDLTLTTAVFLRPNGKKLDCIRLTGYNADEWGVTPDAENLVQLSPTEQDALKEHLNQRAIIPRRDVPVKEPPAFKDRQLQRALEILAR